MRRGFTLLEVLLALTLLAVLMTLVEGVYSGVSRSSRDAAQDTREVHEAAVFLDRLANEISAAYVSPPADPTLSTSWFVLTLDIDGRASLAFTTRLSPEEPSDALTGRPAEVAYYVERDEDGVARLRRRSSWEVDTDPEEGGLPYDALPDLALTRLDIQCYDGEEWHDTWDSRERTQAPYLPSALSVEIAWGDPDHERVLRTSIPVYGSGETQ
jgi:general secretion pathway protein J